MSFTAPQCEQNIMWYENRPNAESDVLLEPTSTFSPQQTWGKNEVRGVIFIGTNCKHHFSILLSRRWSSLDLDSRGAEGWQVSMIQHRSRSNSLHLTTFPLHSHSSILGSHVISRLIMSIS